MTSHDDRKPQQHDDEAGQQEARGGSGRSVAEWVTLAVGAVLILGVVGLVTYLYVSSSDRPPIVEATALDQEIRQEGRSYYLPITVINRGDRTAEDVRIRAELGTGEGTPENAEFTIDFLAGGETAEGTVVFLTDPTGGELTVDVASFR